MDGLRPGAYNPGAETQVRTFSLQREGCRVRGGCRAGEPSWAQGRAWCFCELRVVAAQVALEGNAIPPRSVRCGRRGSVPGGIRAPRDLHEGSPVGFLGEGAFDVFLESRDISVRRDQPHGRLGRQELRQNIGEQVGTEAGSQF